MIHSQPIPALTPLLVAAHLLSPSAPADPVISEIMADNGSTHRGPAGEYEDWIEIHNPDDRPVDLEGWHLTDDAGDLVKWKFPPCTLAPGGFCVVLAAGTTEPPSAPPEILSSRRFRPTGRRRAAPAAALRADFKLDSDGEYLGLVRPDGRSVVHAYSPGYPELKTDRSFGIPLAGAGGTPASPPAVLLRPTPGQPNSDLSAGETAPVSFSRQRGFCDEGFALSLGTDSPGAEIRYTLDGSDPTPENGTVYERPLEIDATAVVRAAALRDRHFPSPTVTHTYLFLEDVARQNARPAGYPAGWVNGQRLRFGMLPELVDNLYTPEEIVGALRALPALSISTSIENLFDARRGIYVNAYRKGFDWERPASLELLPNDPSTTGFQINAGLRVRGGYSRKPDNPKHALRMVFRKHYGAGKLEYPLFGEEGANAFDHIDFRTSLNYSWASEGSRWNNLLRDVFSRDTQRDMGQPHTRSRFYHLFINGLYWGIYQTQERAVAAYASSYMGGKPGDYDVVKTQGQVADGNSEAYLRFHAEVAKGVDTREDYLRLQGLAPDGSPDPQYERLLDVDNLIDHMIVTYYTGDRDGAGGRFTPFPNNFYAIYNREKPDGWKFFEHDSEHSLDTGDQDMTFPFKPLGRPEWFNPHWLHDQLAANQHYLKRFRERVDLHFEPGGALSLGMARQRLETREAEISEAIKAHACRWGNTGLTHETWQAAVDRTRKWMEGRTEQVYDQLRERAWLPGPRSPSVSSPGGMLAPDESLYLLSEDPGAVLYYTLDDTDPRGPDGKPASGARIATAAEVRRSVLLAEGAPALALVPSDQGAAGWQAPDFRDALWILGQTPVGYEARNGYESHIRLNLAGLMHNVNGSVYLRQRFLVRQAPEVDQWVLRVKYDDGFIAWINGERVAAANAPPNPAWNSFAVADHGDSAAVLFEDFPLARSIPLRAGVNVLAVHAMDGEASSDFLFSAQLEGIRFLNGTPLPLPEGPSVLRARAWAEETWSGQIRRAYRR